MSPIEKLVAIDEIKTLKARYWRTLDRRLWNDFERVFTDDCSFDASLSNVMVEPGRMPSHDDPGVLAMQVARGGKAIRNMVEQALRGVRSVHQGHLPEIEILSPTEANAIFPFEDLLDFPAGAIPRSIHGFGHYHDSFRRIDGSWRIASLTIYRLRITMSMDNEIL